MDGKDLFSKLDGMPAQVLVFVGFTLALLAPLIPHFETAGAAGAQAEYEKATALVDLDMEKFTREQEAKAGGESIEGSSYTEIQARQEELKKATDKKKDELEKTYKVFDLKREMIENQATVPGTVLHLWIGWLGRLLLILGLLILTVQSEGAQQKVILILLLVVMFSALSGVNLDFGAQGHLGEVRAP